MAAGVVTAPDPVGGLGFRAWGLGLGDSRFRDWALGSGSESKAQESPVFMGI